MTNLKSLGKKFLSLRKKSKLTQAQLAEKCGFSTNSVSIVENGKDSVSLESYEKLAKALGSDFLTIYSENLVESSPKTLNVVQKGIFNYYLSFVKKFTNESQ